MKTNLQHLCDFLNAHGRDDEEDTIRAAELGLPIKIGGSYLITRATGEIDMTHLPTFGGQEPADTAGIFSWDEKHFLVQKSDGWRLVPRDEFGGAK